MARSLRSPAGRGGLFGLPRPVWLLGWVSLATDSASEAIYPLLPFFLTQVLGAGAVSLGIVEGAAEAANSILKIVSGRAADRARFKRPLVLAGYTISSLARPLIAIAQSWTHVFTIRLVDRVGKGIRGAPRDAMLAGWATPTTRGKIYGFHRAMDHTGAVVGPALASLFLFFYPGSYRVLFALTIIPGAIAVLLIFFVHEPHLAAEVGSGSDEGSGSHPGRSDVGSGFRRIARDSEVRSGGGDPVLGGSPVGSGFSRITDDVVSDPRRNEISGVASRVSRAVPEPFPRKLKGFFGVLSLFTLGNSTDAFLLLKLTDVAGSVKFIPLMWAGLHLVKASVSIVGGSWSDRIGRRAVIVMGWLVYAAVYVGFAITDSLVPLLACFFTYGLYFGFAEGTEKALVADLAPESRRGYAFGVYNAVLGLGALAASILFGVLWSAFGPHVAFGVGAALALLASALLFVVV